jgi:hypothetical protein
MGNGSQPTIRCTGAAGRAASETNVVRRGPVNGGVRPSSSWLGCPVSFYIRYVLTDDRAVSFADLEAALREDCEDRKWGQAGQA